MAERPVGIGLCGLGNVGSGVLRLLLKNADYIEERVGVPLRLRRVLVRDLSKPRPPLPAEVRLTDDPAEILGDEGIDVVVELIGGAGVALELAREALRRGKSVVTANKEIIASHGRALFEAAARGGTEILFEASVGGGIPLIEPLKRSLAANRIDAIYGILNGTTNYILSRMTDGGCEFAEALADAQRRGYAEADPSADVDGHDAARKLAILAGVAFGAALGPEAIHTEGIRRITARDIRYAGELGFVIKLIASGRIADGPDGRPGLSLKVHPTLLPRDHQLAKVDGALNALMVQGDFVGEVVFMGQGAGGDATASAVVADVIEAARHRLLGVGGRRCSQDRHLPLLPLQQTTAHHYLRFNVVDRPGILGQIAQTMGRHQVNLRYVIQKEVEDGPAGRAELVFLTSQTRESDVAAALEELARQPGLFRLENLIRWEGEDALADPRAKVRRD